MRKNFKDYFKESTNSSTYLVEDLTNSLENSISVLILDDLPEEFIKFHRNGFHTKLNSKYKEELEDCLDELFLKLRKNIVKQAINYNK